MIGYNKLLLVTLLFCALTAFHDASAGELNLDKGTVVNGSTVLDLAANSDVYADVRSGLRNAGVFDTASLDAYASINGGSIYYALLSDMTLHELNLPQKMYLGGWGLENSNYGVINLAGEEMSAEEAIDGAHGYEYDPVTNPSALITTPSPIVLMNRADNTAHGCFQLYPLRYGDIDGDGKPELVLFIGSTWIVFSPTLKKVIFETQWKQLDVLTDAEVARWGFKHDAPGDPQYVAKSGTDRLVQAVFPARRAYAKLYFGDFDGNGKPDILMWRKAYQSRLNSDSVKGYKLIGEALVQFELENGVYVKKDTDSATVKGWLAAKNLTWQQGYPNVSECPGEEGKPIPETVDPLLNDPDVLQ